ncbi:hypothetical protein NU195Hw_g2690t1 [Hortaea werneckii]
MEAVAALGVAAASVQFLDFALQALALCRQIRDDAQGATAANKELENYSRSIKDLSKELESGQADNACGRRIKAVAQACIAKTEELLKLLKKIREAGSITRTAAAKTLFRSLKERREIEKLQNELKEKQTLLDSALIQDIQRRFDLGTVKQDENFTSLKQSIQDLVNRLQDQNVNAQQNHAETQDKLTNLAKDSQELRATTVAGHSRTVQRLDQIHVDMGQGFDNLKMSDAKEELLRSLFYPEHAARREMVRPPWSDTFDWVFDETSESTTHWSSFPAWLKCGSSLYWITGKPASGKSTLMAHLFHDGRTANYLQQWSGGAKLHILSFFFWRPGSGLQKSISGLLRSLVMQLADEVPEVAPAILGKLHLRPERMPTWSERGLTDALRLALTAAKDVYLCFLLDGLDEFDGPYRELVDLIFEMKDSKNVKFCVSSRREAGLANRLCQFDHLSMEDLNFEAIRTYARDTLFPVTDGEALSKKIARRSQGVFLWAVLTTQSLIHGALDCSEDVDMLHRRLNSTPDKMSQLFSQILSTVDEVHKQQLYIWIRLLLLDLQPTVAELAVMLMPDCVTTYDALSAACEQTTKHINYFSKGLLCVYMEPVSEGAYGLWHAPVMTRGSEVVSPETLNRRKTQLVASRTFGCLITVEHSFFLSCVEAGLFEYVRRGMHRFFDQDDEGYCMARMVCFKNDLDSDPGGLELAILLLERLREQLSSKRMVSTLLGSKAIFWKRFPYGEWLAVRIPSGDRETERKAQLSLLAANLLWEDFFSFIDQYLMPENSFRPDILLLFIEILSTWDVGIGERQLSGPHHQLVLFVSPSAFLLPLCKPDNEGARLLGEFWSTSRRSMYFSCQNPLGGDADGICSHEVPEAVAERILKRWIDECVMMGEDLGDVTYITGPSSIHVSDHDVDALIEDVWASETIGSWHQLYLLALLRKWQRQRGREGEQASTDQSPGGSEISHEFHSSELSSEDGKRQS